MQLPNKLYSYKNSTLALIPIILNELKNQPKTVYELFCKARPFLNEPTDFLSVMDCLYALQVIDTSDEGEVFLCLQ